MKNRNSLKLGIIAFLSLFSIQLTAQALVDDVVQKNYEEYQAIQLEKAGSKKVLMEDRSEKLKKILIDSFDSFDDAEKQIEQYQKELEPIQQQISTLKEQVSNLNSLLDQTNTKITNIQILMAKKEIDIEELMVKVEKSNFEMDSQKEMITRYLQLSYSEEQRYKSPDENKNLINLLLADTTVSKTIQREVYFSVMEEARRQIFYKLAVAKNEFQDNQAKYNKTRQSLDNLQALLAKEKDDLKAQQIAKEELLSETEGKEGEYQRLIEESKKQQENSAFEIENLQNNLALIQEKLRLLDDTQIQEVLHPVSGSGQEAYNSAFADEQNGSFFEWPVSPSGGITAYYQDGGYYNHFKVVHNAIDIRQRQGSPIFAPANGYVYKAQDNGMGYSYLILAHKDGFMTVYGHISEFIVTEGDLVHTGDLIGLSGGTPGTKGAGWMTTGPHLHFEVYKDGVHVNPLDYLPLEELPIEYIPAEYLKKIKLQ